MCLCQKKYEKIQERLLKYKYKYSNSKKLTVLNNKLRILIE